MPERFEIYVVYKRRYVNTLPFLFPSFESFVPLKGLLTHCCLSVVLYFYFDVFKFLWSDYLSVVFHFTLS